MSAKKINLILVMCLLFMICLTGCGKKKKLSYGDMPGVASGTIDLSGEGAKINIDNIITPIGSDVDYTSGLDVVGDGEYSVEVNASNVQYDKPGTYTVGYKVKTKDQTYTSNVLVTISEDKSLNVQKPSQNIISSSTGENVNVSTGNNGSSQGSSTEGQDNNQAAAPNVPDGSGNQGNVGSQGSYGNQGSANPPDNQGGQTNQTEPPKVLITDSNAPTYTSKSIQNAVIELLSGDVVTIGCSTNKYIIATRTDETMVEKNGHKYQVSKLVIVFNTGDERTLETIEKKID